MFGPAFFGPRFFGGRFFGSGGDADPPADTGAEAVWNYELIPGYSAGDLLKLIAAVAVGKSSITNNGDGTALVEFRSVDDTHVAVSVEMEGSERTSVTLTP